MVVFNMAGEIDATGKLTGIEGVTVVVLDVVLGYVIFVELIF